MRDSARSQLLALKHDAHRSHKRSTHRETWRWRAACAIGQGPRTRSGQMARSDSVTRAAASPARRGRDRPGVRVRVRVRVGPLALAPAPGPIRPPQRARSHSLGREADGPHKRPSRRVYARTASAALTRGLVPRHRGIDWSVTPRDAVSARRAGQDTSPSPEIACHRARGRPPRSSPCSACSPPSQAPSAVRASAWLRGDVDSRSARWRMKMWARRRVPPAGARL